MEVTVWNIIVLIFFMLILPLCIGWIPVHWMEEEKRTVGVTLITGFLMVLSLCWLAAVPCILFVTYDSFLVMVPVYTVLLLAGAACGACLAVQARRKGEALWKGPDFHPGDLGWEEWLGWILFLGLVAWQLFHSFTLASFDGDDAEYVAQSLITQQSNTMYRIMPYTGGTTALDIRHSLAVLPVWIAYLGRMSGLHTTILAHSILPFFMLPLTYLVFYETGKHLLKEKKEQLPGFMVLMALVQMFGNVSIYTNETFFLTRTWQGKAVAASFILPFTVCILLWIFDKEEDRKTGEEGLLWILLALTNMAAGVCTSMVVFLNILLIGAVAFWMMVTERSFRIPVKAGLACIPNGIYMLLYLFLHPGV